MPSQSVPLARNRDFALLWIGHWVSYLGNRMSAVCYPLVALAISGGSATAAGLAGFAAILPNFLLELPAGALVDRWDRKLVLRICGVGRALLLSTTAGLLATGGLTLHVLIGLIFAETTLFIVAMLAERAAIRSVVPIAQLDSAISQNEARGRIAGLVGTPLGTVLLTGGQAAPFVVAAAAAGLAMVTSLAIRSRCRPESVPERRRLHREVAEGVAWVARHRFLRAVVGLVASGGLLLQFLTLALTVLLVREQGRPEWFVGLLFGLGGGGGVLGALCARQVMARIPLGAVFVGGFTLWAGLMAGMSLTGQPVLLTVLYAAMSFVGAQFSVAASVFQVTMTPEALQGRIAATTGLVISGGAGAGSLIAGQTLDGLPVAAVLGLAAAGMAVVALAAAAMPAIRRARREDVRPPDDVAAEPAAV